MRSKRTPQAVVLARRRVRAAELRAAGLTYDRIAERLRDEPGTPDSYDRTAAWRDVEAVLNETMREAAEALVALESERLNRLQVSVWARALRGDLDAIVTVLRIMDRRARLHGLDKALPIAATVSTVTPTTPGQLHEQALDAINNLLPHLPPPSL